jgi:hypothetical protein
MNLIGGHFEQRHIAFVGVVHGGTEHRFGRIGLDDVDGLVLQTHSTPEGCHEITLQGDQGHFVR